MKKAISLILWLALLTQLCFAAPQDIVTLATAETKEYTNEQIVNAIYKAENSKKYPYGIKSIDTKGNEAYARKICFNSVRNAKKRWIKAGKPHDFITFMGLRYCPPKAHTLNSNWVRLVKYFLANPQ